MQRRSATTYAYARAGRMPPLAHPNYGDEVGDAVINALRQKVKLDHPAARLQPITESGW